MKDICLDTIKRIINQDGDKATDGLIIDQILDYINRIKAPEREEGECYEAHEGLKVLIEWQKHKSFIPEYWAVKSSDPETLGLLMAQYLGWSVNDILDLTYSMFEEANMHTYNEQIDEMRTDWTAKA